jgi:hypothetical protein
MLSDEKIQQHLEDALRTIPRAPDYSHELNKMLVELQHLRTEVRQLGIAMAIGFLVILYQVWS